MKQQLVKLHVNACSMQEKPKRIKNTTLRVTTKTRSQNHQSSSPFVLNTFCNNHTFKQSFTSYF